jgi:S1/P1 Nuclease
MPRIFRIVTITMGIAANLAVVPAFAWGPKGHMTVGTIADKLIAGTNAAREVRRILGSNLRTASVWADCAKGVNPTTFKYGGEGQFPECAIYENRASERQMEEFVRRNVHNCMAPHNTEVCHKQYHYTDVAIQRNVYMKNQVGTTNQDIVSAVSAAILVLQGNNSPAPFNLASKKEALRLLAHYVGDIHQPLHVGAVYLDATGHVVDPDQGVFNPKTETHGGNDLFIGTKKLHGEWDAVAAPIAADPPSGAVLNQARSIPITAGSTSVWSTAWATETLTVSKGAFQGVTYSNEDSHDHYRIQVPQGYNTMKTRIQQDQIVKAGARLAQILKQIWPD